MKPNPYAHVFNSSKPGSLHRALGVPADERIPVGKLRIAVKWTGARKPLAAKAALVLRFRAARLAKKRAA